MFKGIHIATAALWVHSAVNGDIAGQLAREFVPIHPNEGTFGWYLGSNV